MKEEKTYHIDVTPEEDALFNPEAISNQEQINAKRPISFAKVFCVVLGAHAALGIGIMATTSSAEAKQKDSSNFAQPIAEIPKQYQQEKLVQATPTPTPSPAPKETTKHPTPAPTPTAKQTTDQTNVTQHKSNDSKYTKEYVVKQGDTLYNIAKKYKLNTERLIKINNIKDVNKLTTGQKLKFM